MRSVAFLRGINVGGHRVTKDQFVAVFESLHCTEVATVQASGNVVFTGVASETDIAAALLAALGYEVPTVVRSADQVRAIVDAVPFPGKTQVVLWREPLNADEAAALLALATADDRLAVIGQEAYWLPKLGVSGSALGMQSFLAFGVNTMRTIGTIERIATKL